MMKGVWVRRLVPLAALAFLACSGGTAEQEKVVASVNGSAITVAELQKKVAGSGRSGPVTRHSVDDQLHLLIEHKLLIQEAVKLGISEDKKFIETIKTFWEQTIIRNLIEAKTGEWSSKIFATDQEIEKEYEKMKCRARIRAVRGARTKEEAEAIARRMQGGKSVAGEEVIGPLFYEDVKGSPLANAFELKEGQPAVFMADEEHIVLCVIERETLPIPPLKEISKRIRESILVQKRQNALAEWIAAVKASSKVEIDEKELRRISHD